MTMAIIRSDPFREWDRLSQQLWGLSHGPRVLAMPFDAYRSGDSFVLEFDLPGVDPDSIDLTVDDTVLTVQAVRPAETANEGVEKLVAERLHGTFRRQVLLGDNLDAEHMEARYADGVLTLTIPMAVKAEPRRIPVSRSSEAKEIKTSG
jgi:HSP20 family protein